MKKQTIIKINNRFNELSERSQIEIIHLINSIASHRLNDYVQKNALIELNNLTTKIHNFYIEDYQIKLIKKRELRLKNKTIKN